MRSPEALAAIRADMLAREEAERATREQALAAAWPARRLVEATARLTKVRPLAVEGRRRATEAGKFTSGPVPFGYRRTKPRGPLEVDPVAGELVRWIFRSYAAGVSLLNMTRELEAKGAKPPRKAWSRAGLSWILRNRAYLGFVRFGGIRAKGRHRALVSTREFNKVGERLRANDKHAAMRRALAEGEGVDVDAARGQRCG